MKVNMDQISGNSPENKRTKPKDVSSQKTDINEDAKKKTFKDLIRTNKFWFVVCGILFVIFLSVNSNMRNTNMGLTIRLRDLTSSVSEYETAIDDVKGKLDEQEKIKAFTLTDEAAEKAGNDAISQGKAVAEYQNAYKNLNTSDTEAFNANVESLDACFDENDKDARTPWYSYKELPGTWHFASKTSFSGNTAEVLWLCYADSDNTLLAYCTGTYNATSKLFSNVSWKLSKYAESKIGTDDSGGNNETSQAIVSVIDSLKAMVKDGDTAPEGSEEKPDKQTIDTNNEISKARESYKEKVKNGEIEGEKYNYTPGITKPKYDNNEGSETNEKKNK